MANLTRCLSSSKPNSVICPLLKQSLALKNRSTGRCPFEIVCTRTPRLTFDLANLPSFLDISDEAENMVERIQSLHQEVHDHLKKTTLLYKEAKDKSRREVHFEDGDLVMIHL